MRKFFGELFAALGARAYAWEPVRPERLLKLRSAAGSFPPLVRQFGLGVDATDEELAREGLSPPLVEAVRKFRPSVSGWDSLFVAHDHWPPSHEGKASYVYLGEESFELLRRVRAHAGGFEGKAAMDLGSGAGALSMELGRAGLQVVGIDASSRAVEWAQAAADAQGSQGLANVRFHRARIGEPEAEAAVPGTEWDLAVFNPPMAIPVEGDARPHRDGGALGIELPLRFLDFAARRLRRGGEAFCLCTNPIVHGEGAFFSRLSPIWQPIEKCCLDDRFNQSLHRKEGYGDRGISRVELWFLRLGKRS